MEPRKEKGDGRGSRLNILGGKREDEFESEPLATALREFNEESGLMLGETERVDLSRLVESGKAQFCWLKAAKYFAVLFDAPAWLLEWPERIFVFF